jgi:flagellar biosynthetic protein FliQ
MSQGDALSLISMTLSEILTLALPLLGIAMIVGLVISIFQATTAIQEQTLTFVPKMIVILLIMVFMGPWYITRIMDFTRRIFDLIGQARM